MMKETPTRNLKRWLIFILVVAVLLRLVLFLTYPPVAYNDSASYRRSANAILEGLADYDGTRTPGYPAFLALVGSDRSVYALQLVMGLGITLSWFYIGYKSTARPVFGALAALVYTLNPGQILFEANLLTETLTIFWLMLAFLGAFIWMKFPKHQSVWLCLEIGFATALAALTRPLFIFMPVWMTIFLSVSYKRKKLRINWKPVVGILLPAILLLGGWMGWVYARYRVFSLTTMTGYHLVQHTGYYFEDVPDEFAGLREVYLEYRQDRIDQYGTQGNTILDAIPAMQEVSGLGFYELSKTLQSISIQLILSHPWAYLSRALRGWWLFWWAPVYWDGSQITIRFLREAFELLVSGSRGLVFVSNMFFVISTIGAVVSRKLRELWQVFPFLWLLAGSVWATSILSSLLDHGDNPRFLIPLQTAVLFWVLWIAYHTWHYFKQDSRTIEVLK
jgi:4-amino-4-deoxy-L-arabinose transferase-like glycosyltransferase